MDNKEKKRNRAITAETFACVKMLIAGGATHQECAKYLKIGVTTVCRIASAENYEEYKNILAAMNAKYHETYRAKRLADKADPDPVPEEQKAAFHNLEPNEEEKKEIAQVIEHRQSVTVQTTYYVNQKMDRIEELLKTISAKLACIIDDLYGTNSNKGA